MPSLPTLTIRLRRPSALGRDRSILDTLDYHCRERWAAFHDIEGSMHVTRKHWYRSPGPGAQSSCWKLAIITPLKAASAV